jgi:hypothetical protein
MPTVYPDVEVVVREGDAPDAAPAPGRARRSSRRWDVVVLVALAAVVVALAYSAVQARDSAREADRSRQALASARRANAFSNVLDLHRKILDAYQRTSLAYAGVRQGKRTAQTESRVVEAVVPLDAIAYLLARDMTPIPSAADVWKRYLICAYYTARAGVGPDIELYVPELARFAERRRTSIGRTRCNAIVLPRQR